MNVGDQVIAVVTVTENPAVRDRYNQPQQVTSETTVRGRFRQLSAREVTELGSKSTEVWKATLPPDPAAINVTTADRLKVDGIVFSVTGVRLHRDLQGNAHHVTVAAEKHAG